jgi:hypothetical protein
MSRAQYVARKYEEYGFNEPSADPEADAWYKAVMLPPERVPICSRCDLDLRAFKRLTREDQKARFKFDCSSKSCMWDEWFQWQRPKDFEKYRDAARMRAVLSGAS